MSDRATKKPNHLPHRTGESAASDNGVVSVGAHAPRKPLAGPECLQNQALAMAERPLNLMCGVALDVLIEAIFGIALFVAVLLLAVSQSAPPPGTPTVSLVLVVPADRPAYYRGESDAPMPSDGFNL